MVRLQDSRSQSLRKQCAGQPPIQLPSCVYGCMPKCVACPPPQMTLVSGTSGDALVSNMTGR
jgi:hypothetical protein